MPVTNLAFSRSACFLLFFLGDWRGLLCFGVWVSHAANIYIRYPLTNGGRSKSEISNHHRNKSATPLLGRDSIQRAAQGTWIFHMHLCPHGLSQPSVLKSMVGDRWKKVRESRVGEKTNGWMTYHVDEMNFVDRLYGHMYMWGDFSGHMYMWGDFSPALLKTDAL